VEGLVDDLQQQPLLWIHDLRLRGAQPEEARVEAVRILDEAAMAHRHHARSLEGARIQIWRFWVKDPRNWKKSPGVQEDH